jgi:predicted polyphosphate/ATP-dependent NAD kinase
LAKKRLGLIVNPIAGIGGRVGLKGSDGLEVQQKAISLGAELSAQERTAAALDVLKPMASEIEIVTAPGLMGEIAAQDCGFNLSILSLFENNPKRFSSKEIGATTLQDTRRAARALCKSPKVDLILFVGGDGTARDIFHSVGNNFPVLGIPAGVKIHSAVFGITPKHSGELALAFLFSKRTRMLEAEVVDMDEHGYRKGQIITRLHGYLNIPYLRGRVQNQKIPSPSSEVIQAQSIAADIIDSMKNDLAYLLGPGTTTRAIAERLGFPKTLVGVDIISRNELLALDVSEKQILDVLETRPLVMIVTPTGGQGFLFGRGNQQISPHVIRQVGRENIIVICLSNKIAALRGRPFIVDTGDTEVDNLLTGYIEVVTGFHEKVVYKIAN